MKKFVRNIFQRNTRYYDRDHWETREWVVVTTVVTGVMVGFLVLVLGLALLGNGISKHYGKQACEAKAELIGNDDYQWVEYHHWSYECANISDLGVTGPNYGRIVIEEKSDG